MPVLTSSSPNSVNSECLAYGEMATKWKLLDALRGGTLAMRAAGTEFLPKETKELPQDYAARLGRSVLYNGYGDTIHKLAAKPFGKPITIDNQSSLPEQVQWIVQDATRNGEALQVFSKQVFEEAVHRGLTHVLVDYPKVARGQSLQDVRDKRIYPYFVHVSPTNLLGWKSTTVNGEDVYSMVRIRETRVEPDGEWGEKKTTYVRVITPLNWTLYVVEDGKETKKDTGDNTRGRVEFHTFYTNKISHNIGYPPLEDLGWINLAHWQSQSDQRNILRFARLGILVATGLSVEEQNQDMLVGPNQMVKLTNPEAKVFYAEHSGKAIAAGDKDLMNLEAKMRILGLQPLVEGGSSTATGQAIEESKTHAQAQTWAMEFSKFLETLFQAACRWVSKPYPEDVKISVFTNFAISIRAGMDAQILTSAAQTGLLSRETYLVEMKRRGFLNEELDIQEELKRIDKQPPLNPTPNTTDQNSEAKNVSGKPGADNKTNEFPGNQLSK